MLKFKKLSTFIPGSGGAAVLTIQKDRPGGLRASTARPSGNRKQIATVFVMGSDSWDWKFKQGSDDHAATVSQIKSDPAQDVATLRSLSPAPVSVNDVKDRLHWGTARASLALKAFRKAIPDE